MPRARVVLLASAAQAQHEVQRALLLDVVVAERAAVLELLAGEYEALLVGRNAFFVLAKYMCTAQVNERLWIPSQKTCEKMKEIYLLLRA